MHVRRAQSDILDAMAVRPWAFWRRAQYLAGLLVVCGLVGAFFYSTYFYTPPTCDDGIQNGTETGIDCGGACEARCVQEVAAPSVSWARSFEIVPGQYNAVGYVENPNPATGARNLSYTFTLFDDRGKITEVDGEATLRPGALTPLFAGRIDTGEREPTRTFLSLGSAKEWVRAPDAVDRFRISGQRLEDAGTSPRLFATIENRTFTPQAEIEVVATIFDQSRNALTSSRTYVPQLAPQASRELVFTWPQPIAGTLRSCEIPTDVVLGIDLSGSMNNDGTTPPQPLTAVLDAASQFVDRLQPRDRAGLVTFATNAQVAEPLAPASELRTALSALRIDPAEEQGETNHAAGLSAIATAFSSAPKNPDARRVAVLLTDGLATAPEPEPAESARQAAAQLKATGVELYAIALGEEADAAFVRDIASPGKSYQTVDRSEVGRIYEEITAAICEDGPAIIEVIPTAPL